jgi:hypothetical protein
MHRVSLNCTCFIMVQNEMLISSLKEIGEKWRLHKTARMAFARRLNVQYSYQFPLFKNCHVIVLQIKNKNTL